MALCFLSSSTCAPAATEAERQVLAAVNFARTDPQGFATALRAFRARFDRTTYTLPGSDQPILTAEGTAAVDETIAFLARQAPLPPIAPADLLARSAAALAAEQGASGDVGHAGADGSTPGERARAVGGGDFVSEVIAYGPVDPVDMARQLIVDDGVADRGHRALLFSPDLRFAGVSCGPHQAFRTMCVIDLGETADGRMARRMLARNDLPRGVRGR